MKAKGREYLETKSYLLVKIISKMRPCVFVVRLQIISNGDYKSVQHRVLANSRKESRISIVVFFNLAKWREDGYCGPLPELLSPHNPPIYRDFTPQEFRENFYGKGIDTKSLIQKITIRN